MQKKATNLHNNPFAKCDHQDYRINPYAHPDMKCGGYHKGGPLCWKACCHVQAQYCWTWGYNVWHRCMEDRNCTYDPGVGWS